MLSAASHSFGVSSNAKSVGGGGGGADPFGGGDVGRESSANSMHDFPQTSQDPFAASDGIESGGFDAYADPFGAADSSGNDMSHETNQGLFAATDGPESQKNSTTPSPNIVSAVKSSSSAIQPPVDYTKLPGKLDANLDRYGFLSA